MTSNYTRPVDLSDDDVFEIRTRYRAGGIAQVLLGREYGISQSHVGRIISGKVRAEVGTKAPSEQPPYEDLVTEIWATIPPFPYYEASTIGRIRRVSPGKGARAGHILRPRSRKDGYLMVALYSEGKRRDVFLHHLILETFVGPRPHGMEGCHKNGNPTDCRLKNLRWGTRESNIQDRINARDACKDGHQLGEWTSNGAGKRTRRCGECRRIKDGAKRRYRPRAKKLL